MSNVDYYGCYDYNEEWYLIEMLINEESREIDWSAFTTPEEGMDERDWQAPYMEQYLNEDGTERICDVYDTPAESVNPCRVAFFIYKTDAEMLITPYGQFPLECMDMPERLEDIVEFDGDYL